MSALPSQSKQHQRRRKNNKFNKGSKGNMNRARRTLLGQETLKIIESGKLSGHLNIAPMIGQSIKGSQFIGYNQFNYLTNNQLTSMKMQSSNTVFEITRETTLGAASRVYFNSNQYNIINQDNIGALNFASAKNPGGGFLKGSNAQEESIARCGGLYPCLTKFTNEYYEFHKKLKESYDYSDNIIYSPQVLMFRNDITNELFTKQEQLYTCNIVTCPAVNATHFIKHRINKLNKNRTNAFDELENIMDTRIGKILDVFASNGNEGIVLGAYGCGVFGNDPKMISKIFFNYLNGKYKDIFKCVVFAIYSNNESREIQPFIDQCVDCGLKNANSITVSSNKKSKPKHQIKNTKNVNATQKEQQQPQRKQWQNVTVVSNDCSQNDETTEQNQNEMIGNVSKSSLGNQPVW